MLCGNLIRRFCLWVATRPTALRGFSVNEVSILERSFLSESGSLSTEHDFNEKDLKYFVKLYNTSSKF